MGLYYRPELTGIAPYSTAVAEHLSRRGARTTALTGMPHYPAWRILDDYRGRVRMRERLAGVDVRRFRTFIPYRQTAFQRSLYEATFGAQILAARGLGSPDAVIGIIPALAGGIGAAFHAARSDAALGLIIQDLSGPAASQSGMPGGRSGVAALAAQLEGWVLRRADRVAVVSEGFVPYLTKAGVPRKRIDRLPNWSRLPSPTRTPHAARRELGWPLHDPIVLHAGNMGLKQGLGHVIAAARAAAAGGFRGRFVLMGEGSQRLSLEKQATDLDNVTFAEPRYGPAYANALTAADVLLVNERATVMDMSLPSKLTSYFIAGRPVLAAVQPGGVTAAEVERSGGGIVVPAEDPQALLAALDQLISNLELYERLARNGRTYARQHLTGDAGLARAERFVADLLEGD